MHEAADIAVRWPLRLRGNGAAPEDTVLVCPRGADAALVFRCGGLHGTPSARQVSCAPKEHGCGQEHRSGVPVGAMMRSTAPVLQLYMRFTRLCCE